MYMARSKRLHLCAGRRAIRNRNRVRRLRFIEANMENQTCFNKVYLPRYATAEVLLSLIEDSKTATEEIE